MQDQLAQIIVIVLVAVSGAASALAAYFGRQVATKTPASISNPTVPLALIERVPSVGLVGRGATSSEIAATILPWYPASYIPGWSQQDEILPDGTEDAERYNNCGETCCAMVVAGVWGVPIEPAALRQYLHGPLGTGLTDSQALVKALHYCSVKAHEESVSGEAAWALILQTVASQRCVIMLGHWEGAGTFLHWVVAVSDGNEILQYVDPWNGSRSYFTHSQWSQLEAGQLVLLDSHIHFDCRTWPDPS